MKILHFLRFGLVLLVLLVASPVASQKQATLDVTVTGIDNSLLKNVQAGLSLLAHRADEQLTESVIAQEYEQADEEIANALEPFGYYSPVITKEMHRYDSGWKIQFTVSPGEPVRITRIEIRLTGPGKENESLKESISSYPFPLKINDILDHQLYEEGKKKLSALLTAGGFRDAVYQRSLVKVNRKASSAQIDLIIDTGPQYFFGKTSFDADFISSNLLQRMLPYRQGEPFSPRKIVQLRHALLNSDYFKTVSVVTGDVVPGEVVVPVRIRLEPRNPNKYRLGVGYGTDTGARGSLVWTNRLLNHYGHQLTVQLQPSERKNNVEVDYTIPIYDPRKDRLSIVGEWEKENFEDTETEARYATVSYDHIGEKHEYSTYLEYLDEDYEVGLNSGHAIFLYPGFRTTWLLADNRLKTDRGVRLTLDIAAASKDVVSDASFLRGTLSGKAIYSFFNSWRLIGRFQSGWTEVDDTLDLSPSLRFYAGGDQSVRGYAYKSIGPVDEEGNVIGASQLLTCSLELERILFGNWAMAVFYDSGDATDSLSDLTMHDGAGVGIRWNAPFGQVRIDVARPVGEDESSWRIHFNVGADL